MDPRARLVLLGTTSAQREEVLALLNEVANGQITGEPEQEVIARVSVTRSLLRRPWRLPPGAPREAIPPTRALLERADRVKFAGERPDPTECRQAVEEVYGIVDATRPAHAAADAERGAA